MKTEFTSKLLQYFARCKKDDQGFTLVELLIVTVIIGVLAAIALPTFLNHAAKARQAEAKQTLGVLVRGQQVYRLEKTSFSNSIVNLGIGIKAETQNYKYQSKADGTGNSGEFSDDSENFAQFAEIFGVAEDDIAVKSYAAGVGLSKDEDGNSTTITVLCESNKPTGQPGGVAAETTYTAGGSGKPAQIECSAADKVL